jgi:hypothetical protein
MSNVFGRARLIRMAGEPWNSAVERASHQLNYETQMGGAKTPRKSSKGKKSKGKKRGPKPTLSKDIRRCRNITQKTHPDEFTSNCYLGQKGRCRVSGSFRNSKEGKKRAQAWKQGNSGLAEWLRNKKGSSQRSAAKKVSEWSRQVSNPSNKKAFKNASAAQREGGYFHFLKNHLHEPSYKRRVGKQDGGAGSRGRKRGQSAATNRCKYDSEKQRCYITACGRSANKHSVKGTKRHAHLSHRKPRKAGNSHWAKAVRNPANKKAFKLASDAEREGGYFHFLKRHVRGHKGGNRAVNGSPSLYSVSPSYGGGSPSLYSATSSTKSSDFMTNSSGTSFMQSGGSDSMMSSSMMQSAGSDSSLDFTSNDSSSLSFSNDNSSAKSSSLW